MLDISKESYIVRDKNYENVLKEFGKFENFLADCE